VLSVGLKTSLAESRERAAKLIHSISKYISAALGGRTQ